MKILMVCLGNICRSPMAEGLVSDMLKQAGIQAEVHSAGTSAYHEGHAPDLRAQEAMKSMGHDISAQRSRPFTVEDFAQYDRIYVMDKSNYRAVVALASHESEKKKVDLFLNLAHPGENREVPDPYYQSADARSGFLEVYELLKPSAEVLVTQLKEHRA